MIPLPVNYINEMKHGELAPMRIDDKVWVEQADGSKKTKFRPTHDQSSRMVKHGGCSRASHRDSSGTQNFGYICLYPV